MSAQIARRTLLSSATSPFKAATAATKRSDSKPDVMGWKAWYSGGRVYSSANYSWEELPKDGILGVVVYHEPPYRTVVSSGDWFWLEDGMVRTSETTWDGWVDPPDADPTVLKRGVGVSDEEWTHVQTSMMEDKEWP